VPRVELIGQIPSAAKGRMVDPVEDRRGQVRSGAPDGRVFEAVVGHDSDSPACHEREIANPRFGTSNPELRISNLRFQISDFKSQISNLKS
jgi:hypothetical protein